MKKFFLIISLFFVLASACQAQTLSTKGQVVDTAGKPVAGINVYAVLTTHSAAGETNILTKATVTTDKDGRFSFPDLPEPDPSYKSWTYDLIAYKAGEYLGFLANSAYVMTNGLTAGLTPENGYTIKVSKPGKYKGQVVDPKSSPIPGVKVSLTKLFGPGKDGKPNEWSDNSINVDVLQTITRFTSATTDDNGNFEMDGIPSGTQPYMTVEKKYWSQQYSRAGTQILMAPAGALKGKVVDEKGNALKGIKLAIEEMYMFFPEKQPVEVVTRDDGTFETDILLPGNWGLAISPGSELTAKAVKIITVKQNETTEIPDIVAVPGVFVSGQVTDIDTGEPVQANIYAYGNMNANSPIKIKTDMDGRYSIRVYPGNVVIKFSSSGTAYTYDQSSITVRVGEDGYSGANLKVKKADIASGVVVDENGNPVSNVRVSIDGEPRSISATDNNGEFKLILPPEDYLGKNNTKHIVEAISSSRDAGIYQKMDKKNLLSDNLKFVLKPAEKLKVTVKGPDGKPLSGAHVAMCTNLNMHKRYALPLTTDGSGCVAFRIYFGGEYEITAYLKGYYCDQPAKCPAVGVTGWKNDIELPLIVANRVLKGKVVDKDGNPLPNATVSCDQSFNCKTNENGEFTLGSLPDKQINVYAIINNKTYTHQVNKGEDNIVIKLDD